MYSGSPEPGLAISRGTGMCSSKRNGGVTLSRVMIRINIFWSQNIILQKKNS